MTKFEWWTPLSTFLDHPPEATSKIQQGLIDKCINNRIFVVPSEILTQVEYERVSFDLTEFYGWLVNLEESVLSIFVSNAKLNNYYKICRREYVRVLTAAEHPNTEGIRVRLTWNVDQVTSKLLLEENP